MEVGRREELKLSLSLLGDMVVLLLFRDCSREESNNIYKYLAPLESLQNRLSGKPVNSALIFAVVIIS